MTNWLDTLSKPLEAVRHGVDEADPHFASVHEGPLTFDRIDYPAAQTYIEEFARAGPTEWTIAVSTTLYFRWSRGDTLTEDILHPTSAVLSEVFPALEAVGCITDYHPSRIDFFSGEPNNDLVLAVSIRFEVTTLLDPIEFGETN